MNTKSYILSLGVFLLLTLSFSGMSGQTAQGYNEMGNEVLKSGQYDQAISYYDQAIRRDPYNGVYYRNRANAYFNKGEYQAAHGDYSRSLRYYRNDRKMTAQLYYQRGLCSYILRNYEESLQDFTSAIAFRPDVPDAYYFRGKIHYMVLDQATQARRDFEKVINLGERNSIQVAFAYFFTGQPFEAESIMKTLLGKTRYASDAEYANVNYNMSGMQALMGRTTEAVFYLEAAIKYGFSESEWLNKDINFDKIRYTSAFREVAARLGAPVARPAEPVTRWDPPFTYDNGNPQAPDRPSAPAAVSINGLAFKDADSNNRIDANEHTYIHFTLRNDGRGTARDLELRVMEESGVTGVGYTQSQGLGDLETGAEKKVSIQINGGQDLITGQAEFRISVVEKNGFDASPVRISIPTQAFLPPQVAVVDHHFTSEVGGKARLGVPINLKLAVQNQGQGQAEEVVMILKVPENVFTAGESEFRIGSLAAGESKIIDFEFFTNRRYDQLDVPIYAEIKEKYGRYGENKTFTISLNQDLEVESRVVVRADPLSPINIDEVRLRSDVDLNLPRTQMRNANAVAVIIGNRDYLNPDVPPVDFALQDAASMKRYLVNVFGFDENNIIELTNATQADFNGTFGTKESHKARLFNLVKAGESDVFVFYSGHGAPDIEEEKGYFVPVDCDPSLVRFNGYSIETFYENLSKIPYRSLMVVIDACFSGSSDKGTLMPYTSLARVRSQTGVLDDPNAVILTSASGDQVSTWYPDQYHSLFTYYFLKGLQGEADANSDSFLSLGELRGYLGDKVPYMARRLRNRVQTPEINGKDSKVIVEY